MKVKQIVQGSLTGTYRSPGYHTHTKEQTTRTEGTGTSRTQKNREKKRLRSHPGSESILMGKI